MRYAFFLFILCTGYMAKAQLKQPQGNLVPVVHGGAGTVLKSRMTRERELAYKTAISEAPEKGYAIS
ncbi:hypothetical protein [Agriterribacter sp.]|uniref:hypothetical protein n=1 Tax=Agriterribacter sp. TaxID=2821509 RepID=UPI002C7B55A6|nr:hypothetical protein [Agriterribacter sp.]HRP55721.1 hypothetical protein [Agriterribacter sp.]